MNVSIELAEITATDIRSDFLRASKRAEAGEPTPEYRLHYADAETMARRLAADIRRAIEDCWALGTSPRVTIYVREASPIRLIPAELLARAGIPFHRRQQMGSRVYAALRPG